MLRYKPDTVPSMTAPSIYPAMSALATPMPSSYVATDPRRPQPSVGVPTLPSPASIDPRVRPGAYGFDPRMTAAASSDLISPSYERDDAPAPPRTAAPPMPYVPVPSVAPAVRTSGLDYGDDDDDDDEDTSDGLTVAERAARRREALRQRLAQKAAANAAAAALPPAPLQPPPQV